MASDRFTKLKCPRWVLFVAVACLVIAVIGLIAIPISRVLSRDDGRSYVVMVDAGSSSSKLYVYSWPTETAKGTPGDIKQEYFQRTRSKGVSAYADRPHMASKEIVNFLRKNVLGEDPNGPPAIIPPNQRASTPIYMAATAGMRLLEARNRTASDNLLQSIRTDFSKLGLQVTNAEDQMKIITGDEEALAGWISSNYLYNTLRKGDEKFGTAQKGTIGALDMGGASTQISFVTDTPIGKEVTELNLYKRKLKVYQHSFLCYGKGEARNQIYAKLWLKAGRPRKGTNPIPNPCTHRGFSLNVEANEFLQKPCFNSSSVTNLPDDKEEFQFQGTGNYKECRAMTNALFDKSKCDYRRCSFNGIFQPELPAGKFVAFSSYYFAMKFFNVTRDASSRNKFRNVLDRFCSLDWNSVKIQYKNTVSGNFLAGYCFDGVYIDMVVETLGFSDKRWSDITFAGKIGNRKMSWPLGYILKNSAKVPPGISIYSMPTSTYAGLVVIFVLILIVCILVLLGYFLSYWWGHRYTRADQNQIEV